MRILIIAGTRVGGTTFSNWLAMELGIPFVMEPDSTQNNNEWNDDACVTKIIYGDNIKNHMNKNWDYIFGITRNNTFDCTVSGIWSGLYKTAHNKYKIPPKWIEENIEEIKKQESIIIDRHENIKSLPIVQLTYEKIFNTQEDIEQIKNILGISKTKYEHILSIENRLREVNKKLL